MNKGGSVTTSVSKKTYALIVENKEGKTTGKSSKAIECGVKIYTREEFKELITDTEFDLWIRKAISLYEGVDFLI